MPTTTQIEATLNINAIGARSDFAGVTSGIDDLSAEEIRFDQKIFEEGILEPTAGFQVVAGGGGTMDVIVGSGAAKVDYAYVSGDTVGQGNYLVRLDDVTKTITLDAPDAAQQRIDEIWLVVLDDVYDNEGKALPVFAVREGDVGGSAPGPDPTWEAALKLATVTIPGGSSDITEASIQDNRVNAKMVVPAIEATDGTFNGVDIAAHAHTGAAGQGGDVDAGDLLNLKSAVDAAGVDADTVDGSHASAFAAASHVGAGGAAHATATPSTHGFMGAAEKAKLDGIEAGATQDQSAAEILALIKTVDGSGSGLDADLLDGLHSGSFSQTSHLHDGRYSLLGHGHAASFADNHVIQQGNYIRLNDPAGEEVLTMDRTDRAYFGVGVNVTDIAPTIVWPHNNANGSLRWMGTGNVFAQAHTGSSEKLKTQTQEIDLDKALFSKLDPIWFKYREDHPLRESFGESWDAFENPDEYGRMGFSWEQVHEVAPHWALESDDIEGDAGKSVAYEGMLPDFMAYSTAAIKQLRAELAAVKEELATLKE